MNGMDAAIEFFARRAARYQAKCAELRDLASEETNLAKRVDLLHLAWRWERIAALFRRIAEA